MERVKLSDDEIRHFAGKIKPIVEIGPFKFWIPATDVDENFLHRRPFAFASVKKIGEKKVEIRPFFSKGKLKVSQVEVLSCLSKTEKLLADCYTLEIINPSRHKQKVIPQTVNAKLVLFKSKKKPASVVLQEVIFKNGEIRAKKRKQQHEIYDNTAEKENYTKKFVANAKTLSLI